MSKENVNTVNETTPRILECIMCNQTIKNNNTKHICPFRQIQSFKK